ncbi:isoprenoid biosynthesis glyoxalase ElbB [Candidatus Sororendozoicomonas aggregata]|uniref:isoprenoid biosynthesis glyoxalase ElbB n=1 Tax=Candidatus Sororendozoicomonas aggregata TaxID=3073239 RepID=UPI002ED1A5BD
MTPKKIALILSGSGVFDGAEIHESVLTLLSIDRAGAQYQCFAPDIEQHHVINHVTGEAMNERRNVLVESARIARGDIKALAALNVSDYDALIIPGGFGAAKNLSDFAFTGSGAQVQSDVLAAVQGFATANKPVGLICIAPAITGRAFAPGTRCTIGNDKDTAKAIEATGAVHVNCPVDDIVVDESRKLITTPAYMLAQSIGEAATGIDKLVQKVIALA